MIRAAAKNFNDVVVLSNPDDYEKVMKEWDDNDESPMIVVNIYHRKSLQLWLTIINLSLKYLNELDNGLHDYNFEKATSLRYGEILIKMQNFIHFKVLSIKI